MFNFDSMQDLVSWLESRAEYEKKVSEKEKSKKRQEIRYERGCTYQVVANSIANSNLMEKAVVFNNDDEVDDIVDSSERAVAWIKDMKDDLDSIADTLSEKTEKIREKFGRGES